MIGIYLAACKARHEGHYLFYQDIDEQYGCDFNGDMLDFDVSHYDYVIATPPCNWWSKVNQYRCRSVYAWKTLSLLPLTIIKLAKSGKLFIIENVINHKRFEFMEIYKLCYFYKLKLIEHGRHTYITNVLDFDCSTVEQHQDFINGGIRINNDGYNQGGSNVHAVIEHWLQHIKA